MKAYISCPLTEPITKVNALEMKLKQLGYDSCRYVRNTPYSDTDLRKSDIFVLVAKDNKFDMPSKDMSAGCKKELELAHSLGKPLWLAYWKLGNELNIYPISIQNLPERVVGTSKVYLQPLKNTILTYEAY